MFSSARLPVVSGCAAGARLCNVQNLLSDNIVGSNLAVMPQSGHMTFVDQPDLFIGTVNRFLAGKVQTLGMSLLAGRAFQSTNRADSPRVAIVNELFAKHCLGKNPIGKRIRLSQMEIIAEAYGDPAPVPSIRMFPCIVASISLLGLGLALVGLYAVVAYRVARRTREIGIRTALGADRPQVMQMTLNQAAATALMGISIGLVVSLASGRALMPA
jgi:ABC-type antimicrobial peptide transport system permease subunit